MNMANIPTPPPLKLNAEDLAEEWKYFRASYTNFEIASGLDAKEPKLRSAFFLSVIGSEAFKWYCALPITAEEKATMEGIMNAIEKHIMPKRNVVYERYRFETAKQSNGETFDQFFTG